MKTEKFQLRGWAAAQLRGNIAYTLLLLRSRIILQKLFHEALV